MQRRESTDGPTDLPIKQREVFYMYLAFTHKARMNFYDYTHVKHATTRKVLAHAQVISCRHTRFFLLILGVKSVLGSIAKLKRDATTRKEGKRWRVQVEMNPSRSERENNMNAW